MKNKIPHAPWQKFPQTVNLERSNGQVLLALRNGEPLEPFMLDDLKRILVAGSPGSANWMALDYAACYLHNYAAHRDLVVQFLKSQLDATDARSGFMAPLASADAPYGRDELGSKGNHGAWSVFAVGAIYEKAVEVLDSEVGALCIRWLRMFAYFFDLQRTPWGQVIGAAVRDGEPSELCDTLVAQLTGNGYVPPDNDGIWRVGNAKGGVPFGIGPMMIRELLRNKTLRPFGDLSDSDLVGTKTVFHILETTEGRASWLVAELGPGSDTFTPYAAAWNDSHVESWTGKRSQYTGPKPVEDGPGIVVRGTPLVHRRGDWTGWVTARLSVDEPIPAPAPQAPPPSEKEDNPWTSWL